MQKRDYYEVLGVERSVGEKLGHAVASTRARMTEGAHKALKILKPVGRKAQKAKTVGSLAVLENVRFHEEKRERKRKKQRKLVKAYHDRIHELNKVMADPMKARTRIHARLGVIRQHDMKLADQLETLAMKKLMFLHDKAPKNPRMGSMFDKNRETNYQPSDMEIAKWAKYIKAADDPMSVIDDINESRVTHEAVETMRTLYPEMYQQIQVQMIESIPQMREDLPYKERLQLSIFFQVPVDSSLNIVSQLQENFVPSQQGEGQGGQGAANLQSIRKTVTQEETAAQRITS